MGKQNRYIVLGIMLALIMIVSGCADASQKTGDLRDNTPVVLSAKADGAVVYENEIVSLDASYTGEGYFMLCYNGASEKVKAIVVTPDETSYTYPIGTADEYHTLPLTSGNGEYRLTVYENIPNAERDDLYASVFSQTLTVSITDEFKPFLYPNQYVNFTESDEAIMLGSELGKETYSDIDMVSKVYHYVTENIVYDTELAETVSFGYLPDVNRTLSEKKGICFDYAALMTAMLRSQRIPTKLEVGYSGTALHAWISTYVDDVGWVDNVIEFTGDSWALMDPTLAASNDKKQVKKYIGDGNHYSVKYSY